jgi:hypothetical protein
MAVYLLRNYQGFTASTSIPYTFQDDVETALIAQGLAVAGPSSTMTDYPAGTLQSATLGGNIAVIPEGQGGAPSNVYLQGNSILTNIALGSLALTSYETNGVTQTAGQWNYSEIFVPYWNTWKGAGVLNGTTVGTSKYIVALWGTSGALVANSATAGTLSAGASVMQNIPFVNTAQVATTIRIPPGRYFIGLQMDVATDTVRHVLSANGSNVICGTQAGTFATVPNITTVSTTFTTAVAPICQLYTV